MLSRWLKANDLDKYCAAAAGGKTETQKTTKRFDTPGNSTQSNSRMRQTQTLHR